jgi:hypothetical protein
MDFLTVITSYRTLHIPSTRNHNGLATNIREKRTGDSQDRAGSLRRATWSPQWDIGKCNRSVLWRLSHAGDTKSNLLSIRGGNKRTLLLRLRQARGDVPKRDGVGADAERWSPLLSNDLGEADNTGLADSVVGLSGVAVHTGGGGDVDDVARLAVLDAEVGGGSADELEGGGVVDREHGLPLLVGHLAHVSACLWLLLPSIDVAPRAAVYWRAYLVDNSVPSEASVVHDDMNFAISKLCRLLHQVLQVVLI